MIGVTPFISMFKPVVDWNKKAKRKAKEEGVSEEEIKKEWEEKKEKGNRIHLKLQSELEGRENVLSYHTDFSGEGAREALIAALPEKDEKLENNKIYLERPIFSHKQGLWGFPDKIEVVKNTIHIQDYKTWNAIYRVSQTIKTPTGFGKEKFYKPIDNLDNCNFNEAILQLSLYMYILWENNRHLKVGNLSIKHIQSNSQDDIIGEEVIEVPYFREEIRELLKYKKLNKI